MTLLPKLAHSVEALLPQIEKVSAERRQTLDRLAGFVSEHLSAGKKPRLTFICTHNSRRSHLGQLWAATAATHFGMEGVETFSGGTEGTAFNPRAIAALERSGFAIEDPGGNNPRYRVSFAEQAPARECFSKRYDHSENPQGDFAAVMTCTEADQACPLVPGAALRVALPYVDPKVSDGTEEEAATYDERSRQVATEMLYLFSKVRVVAS